MTDPGSTVMHIDVRPGESVELQGGLVSVQLVHKTGQSARLMVTAPREVLIQKKGDASAEASRQAWQYSDR